MTDPRIAEGVKLVPELQLELKYIGQYSPPFKDGDGPQISRRSLHTIIAALQAAGEMAGALEKAEQEIIALKAELEML